MNHLLLETKISTVALFEIQNKREKKISVINELPMPSRG